MRWGLLGVAPVMACALAGAAVAADRDDNWARCKDLNPDVALAGCAALIASGKEAPADLALARYNRGEAYASKGQYDLAIKDYDEAITLYPKYAHAFSSRGYAWWTKRQYDRAIADFDQAVALDPKFAQALNYRGNAYRGKGQQDRAIEDYDQAIRLLPKFADAYANRGIANQAKGDYDRAIEDYDKALALDAKVARVHYDRATAYAAKGDLDRAIEGYGQAIERDPKYVGAFFQRGNTLQSKGDLDRAVADYDRVLTLEPRHVEALTSRGHARFAAGRFADAASDLAQSLTLDPARPYDVLWLHLARARTPVDDTAELKRTTARLDLKTWPGPIVAFYLKRLTASQVDEAAALADAQATTGQQCEASFYLGEEAVLRHNVDEAAKRLGRAHEICPPSFVEYDGATVELARLPK